jgi:hypothetical protein
MLPGGISLDSLLTLCFLLDASVEIPVFILPMRFPRSAACSSMTRKQIELGTDTPWSPEDLQTKYISV